jgi:iron complex outermembrane receptor protein
MLEDLEKIEVVRGPGSTLWGANAVNGVINIVSKRAGDTQGGLLYGGGGSPQQVVGGARYGGQVSSNTFFRVYGMYQQSDAFPLRATGQVGPDRWNLSQGGFRIDHEMGGNGLLTWQGDGYFEEMPGTVESACGANTLGRYRRNFSDTSSVELQAYFDYTYRRTFLFETPRQVADLDFQHNFALGTRQALMWGVGYRLNHSEYASRNPLLTVERDSLTTHLFSAFVEDVIEVVPDKVTLTPGCKLEHNDMTGLEPQPGLRLAVRPADGHLLWASVSRAVRMPGDGEYYGVLSYPGITPQGPGYYATEPNVGSERLLAYELGYRVGILKNLSADVATYYNDYDGVIAVAPNGETMPSGLPRITSQNLLHGGIYGGELALTYRPMEPWRLTAWYALSFADLDAPAIVLPEVRRTENRVPTHQACLRSSLDIGRHWLLDAQLRYVDNVDTAPAYLEADSRLAWRPTDRLELALTVQNLLHEEHFEFRQAASAAHASVPRGVYVKLTWRF